LIRENIIVTALEILTLVIFLFSSTVAWAQKPNGKQAEVGYSDLYAPLVIIGEGWSQQFIINNVDDEGNSLVGELRFYQQNGDPWAIDVVGQGTTDRVFVTLRPGQMFLAETVVKNQGQILGFAKLETDCCAWHVGQTLYRKQTAGRPDLMTSMPLPEESFYSTTIPFDNRDGKYAGVGVVNAESCFTFSCSEDLLYIFRDQNGSEIRRVNRSQRNWSLTWFSLSADFPELAGRIGTVEVRSATTGDFVSLVGFPFSSHQTGRSR
jgi:hypothetical protein